ncbi:uncharacterized protein LOC62_03G004756 [Vanrija pseudolonga]|uniref:Uncharacterized protein n=1 Tax=Vanrija pseudolonga TaxID=143232 RepID=A0AAF0Y7A5_9TREE|nr:hypothetical protein LOC62_03G004756 [Vanrija pseudolonga]
MSATRRLTTLRPPLRPASSRPSALLAQASARRTLLQSAPQRPDFPLDVPPISARLKPLVPFFIAWSVITSLAVHLMRARKQAEEEQARAGAQESVLTGLADRFRAGEDVSDEDIRRELEMVGLRERTALTLPLEDDVTELRDVSWFEVFLGRRKKAEEAAKAEGTEVDAAVSEAQAEAEAVVEWSKIVNEATKEQAKPEPQQAPGRTGTAKRAASASVFI